MQPWYTFTGNGKVALEDGEIYTDLISPKEADDDLAKWFWTLCEEQAWDSLDDPTVIAKPHVIADMVIYQKDGSITRVPQTLVCNGKQELETEGCPLSQEQETSLRKILTPKQYAILFDPDYN